MPAEVQQILKSSRSASAQSRKSATAVAGEEFVHILKQANKPKSSPPEAESPKPAPAKSAKPRKADKKSEVSPASEEGDRSEEPKSVKSPATDQPAEDTQAVDEAPQENDNPESVDLTDEHHEAAAQDYVAAAQVAVPQQTNPSQNKPTGDDQHEQSTSSQTTTAVVALNGRQISEAIETQEGQPVQKTTPGAVAQGAAAPNSIPQSPVDPAVQAKANPAITLGAPLEVPPDGSNVPSVDQHKAQQANSQPNANPVAGEMAVAQSIATAPDRDQPTAAKTDLTSKLDLVVAPLGDSSAPKLMPAVANAPAAPPPVAPEAQFAQANHAGIVTALRSEIAGSNGTMHIRLDPPELGALQVTVRMRDGIMSAAFETSNDQATKLLSHTLGQLKQVLESQGVTIDKLHVQQSARSDKPSSGEDNSRQQPHQDGGSARQEQQRKEMIRRMWRRLGVGNDPLDLVA